MEPTYTSHDLILTLALSSMALAIAGATALAIFWPLTHVQLRDLHPGWVGRYLVQPKRNRWLWFLRGGFTEINDPRVNGLARPLQISLWVIAFGLSCAGLLWLISEYLVQ